MSALTKILIVLQMVLALVCSVLLVLMVSKQQSYKEKYDSAMTSSLGSSAALADAQKQNAILLAQATDSAKRLTEASNALSQALADKTNSQAQLEADKLKLQTALAAEQAKSSALSAGNSTLSATNSALNTELAGLRPQVSKLTTDNSELNRAIAEANNQLRAAEQAIRKLQEAAIAGTGPGAAAPMGSEGQITAMGSNNAAAAKVNGQISDVQTIAGRTAIELPLGTRDGIQVNTKLFVYRGNGYVADAVVQAATPEQSVAVIVKTKTGETVQKGDLVSTISQ